MAGLYILQPLTKKLAQHEMPSEEMKQMLKKFCQTLPLE
jgi:hypothetical protein